MSLANIRTKARLKPPLVKFRMGELFGRSGDEALSVIESISYTYPDNSPWETEQGKRVPKFIEAGLTMKLIHADAPSAETNFYGINV